LNAFPEEVRDLQAKFNKLLNLLFRELALETLFTTPILILLSNAQR
jgi:hypothetical protein